MSLLLHTTGHGLSLPPLAALNHILPSGRACSGPGPPPPPAPSSGSRLSPGLGCHNPPPQGLLPPQGLPPLPSILTAQGDTSVALNSTNTGGAQTQCGPGDPQMPQTVLLTRVLVWRGSGTRKQCGPSVVGGSGTVWVQRRDHGPDWE